MIVVVDYGRANIGSVLNMLKRVGAEARVARTCEDLADAHKLILPGVGAFDPAVERLRDSGMGDVLTDLVLNRKAPVLGLCLGMQLLTRGSEEGSLPGLGWIPAETRRFCFEGDATHLKIPHMGWNGVRAAAGADLFHGLEHDVRFYFVHSYHVVCDRPMDVAAWTRFGYEFASSVQHGNIYGTQFHPEKSHRFGMQLLKNFAERV